MKRNLKVALFALSCLLLNIAGLAAQETSLFTVVSTATAGEKSGRFPNSVYLKIDPEALSKVQATTPEKLDIAVPAFEKQPLQLELEQVNIWADEPNVSYASGKRESEVLFRHYRGKVKGKEGSMAALTISDAGLNIQVHDPGLGHLLVSDAGDGFYAVHRDETKSLFEEFSCSAKDENLGYGDNAIRSQFSVANQCIRVYFEVDHNIFLDKGGSAGTRSYIEALFNQVSLLYEREGVKMVISNMLIWDTPSPYQSSSSSGMLDQFQAKRTSFDGDIGQLLSYQASGGVAVVGGLCHPFTRAKTSFSSIRSSYAQVPTYSYSVMVVAHELGHLLGSQHTHACVWNGNNTAIDGCAGFTENGCPNPGIPAEGGTIMSYCHIQRVGINFNLGFGQQPGNVIRNFIAGATCTKACTTTGGGGSGGSGGGTDNGGGSGGSGGSGGTAVTCKTVKLILTFDNHAKEVSWTVKTQAGALRKQSTAYAKNMAGKTVQDTFCLAPGCYFFEIKDSEGDGICCQYGSGRFELRDEQGGLLFTGGSFTSSQSVRLCVESTNPDNGGGSGGNGVTCTQVPFTGKTLVSYGGSQDEGLAEILENKFLLIRNNAWKALPIDYTITPKTIISFEFGSTQKGEIHGIGFDEDDNLSFDRTFKLFGTQNWGYIEYDNYPGDNTWRSFTIPVGKFYTGKMSKFFFVADHDGGLKNGNSFFRNVRIYEEGTTCNAAATILSGPEPIVVDGKIPAKYEEKSVNEMLLYPNPAKTQATMQWEGQSNTTARIRLMNSTGQTAWEKSKGIASTGTQTEVIPIQNLSPGLYWVEIRNGQETLRKSLTIVR